MITFDVITLFPQLFDSFLSEAIVARAQKQKKIRVRLHNPRRFAADRHKTVDDRPYGGGAGMVLKIDPLVKTLRSIRKKKRVRIVVLAPAGKPFTQKRAQTLSRRYDQIILICGRYEGIDSRIKKYCDEELSLGPFVLNGGEVPAMAVIEAVARLVPGVLGNRESLTHESCMAEGTVEHPHYTRPEEFEGRRVPKVLLSGDHKKIAEWRAGKTRYLSPKRG